jgi:hypothetical protein
MAGSFMARLRARIEQLQTELQPEAGIDRRAYGYGDGADDEDATFEEVAREEESPWRRGPSGPMPSADEPGRAAGSTGPARGSPSPASEPPRPRAATTTVTRATRREAFDPYGVSDRQTDGGLRREVPSPPPREAPAPDRAPGSPAAAVRSSAPREPGRTGTRRSTRLQRIRRRIRHPDSLRELFLLRELIDRPIALRRRSWDRPPS